MKLFFARISIFYFVLQIGVTAKVEDCSTPECKTNQYSFEVLLKEKKENLKWDEKYANEKNEEFQKLSNKVRSKLGVKFQMHNVTGIKEIQVKRFREGSVNAEFSISLTNNTNTTKELLVTVLNSTNSSLDIDSSQEPRTINANLEVTSFVWKDSYATSTSCQFSTIAQELKTILYNIYKSVPGLIDLEILGLKKTGDEKARVQFRMLLDSSSDVTVKDLEQTFKDNGKGSSPTGSMRLDGITMEEVTLVSNTDNTGKPLLVLLLVALSCIAIFTLIVLFMLRVMGKSFARPKFKFGNGDATKGDKN